MPPKRSIRRPASIFQAAKAKSKAVAKARPNKQKHPETTQRAKKTERRLSPEAVQETTFPLNSLLEVELFYLSEVGKAYGKLAETHQDSEGRLLGILIAGTNLPSLRQWRLSHPNNTNIFYVCYIPTPHEKRLTLDSVGYLKKVRKVEAIGEEWGKNCEAAAPPPTGVTPETQALHEAAHKFGFRQGLAAEAEAPAPEEPFLSAQPSKPSKKQKGSTKVKEMVARSKWSSKGTPLDPRFKRPVKVSLKEKKTSSSSSNTSSSSQSSSLSNDPQLRKISKKLPGYLCRRASKEAATVLSQSTAGEQIDTFQVFRRYYRQVLLTKVTSKPLLREMQTISTVIDTILDGNILSSLDMLSQRLKSLELLATGTPAELASQVELIPKDFLGLTSQAEGRFAKKEFAAETKLQKALKGGKGKADPPRFTEAKGTKGHAKGNGKGAPKGGKEKADESKVVRL